ncbi:MAG: helix-turn-helix domain-containing protein [Treponema sp.]|jgi:cytoskeletal protein RodZ|nr:helix-turn-helix domain-containing protein [Treponema sp.]
MISLGEKLRTAREAKKLSHEQASRDTNIAIRYLDALEREDFSGFPGETYITGFIRNYGAYLDLDTQELLSLYRAFKIQEQPVPVEQLLRPPPKFPKIVAAIGGVLVILGIGAAVFLRLNQPPVTQEVIPVVRSPVEHIMSGDAMERRFYKGDTILVPVGTDQYKLELVNLGEVVTLRTPQRTIILELGQEVNEDLSNDSLSDLRISVADFAKNNAAMGVLLRFEMSTASSTVTQSNLPAEASAIAEPSNATVVFSSPNPYPFTLQSSFQGYCMFRWEILFERDRRDRNERYFQRSDELNIQAQNGIRIWASNAQAAKFQVIGGGRTVPVELGGAGEVVVTDIRWVRDDDNRYRLIIARLET